MQKFCTVWSCPDIFGGKRIKLSKAGYFAHSLHAYGRDGLPCDRCGTLIRREAFMNRSSHYCPKCQRLR